MMKEECRNQPVGEVSDIRFFILRSAFFI